MVNRIFVPLFLLALHHLISIKVYPQRVMWEIAETMADKRIKKSPQALRNMGKELITIPDFL